MPATDSSPKLVQFGVFELDLRRAEVRKQGVKVKLQEQPLKILQLLLESPGQIVSREQLRSRIWPADTFVEFDKGLYSAMARLRDALGDSDSQKRVQVHCACRRVVDNRDRQACKPHAHSSCRDSRTAACSCPRK